MLAENTKRSLVYGATALIPKGKVTTYGILAKLIGIANPRVVGNILHKNSSPGTVPCHRVVNAQGKVALNYAFGGSLSQLKRLEKEGVKSLKGRVNLKKYLWQPSSTIECVFKPPKHKPKGYGQKHLLEEYIFLKP